MIRQVYAIVSDQEVEIRFDSQGHWLQSCLNRLLAAGLTVDGAAGNRTRGAVKEFQRRVAAFVPGTPAPLPPPSAGPALQRWAPSGSSARLLRGSAKIHIRGLPERSPGRFVLAPGPELPIRAA